jgi:hypothetical protein
MSLLSFGFIVFASSNYDSYYWQARSAILDSDTNNTYVNSVKVTKDFAASKITVRVSASATNPTNYSGLTIQNFQLDLFFLHAGNLNESIFNKQGQHLLATTDLDRSLDPKSTVSTDIVLNLNSTQSSSFIMFNQTYGGNVAAHVVLTTVVNSFLDPVYGLMTTLKEQEISVSWR